MPDGEHFGGHNATCKRPMHLFLNQQHVVPIGIADESAFGKSGFVLWHCDNAGRNETNVRVA